MIGQAVPDIGLLGITTTFWIVRQVYALQDYRKQQISSTDCVVMASYELSYLECRGTTLVSIVPEAQHYQDVEFRARHEHPSRVRNVMDQPL